MKQRKIKNEKAITLIALVITIIMLLILAGITISQLSGSGLFERAKEARDKYKNSYDEEQRILEDYYAQMNGTKLPENTPENPQTAGTEVALKDGWGIETTKTVRTKDGTEVTALTKVSTVYAVSVGNAETVPVPKGFYYVGGTLDSGVVISDDSRDKNKFVSRNTTNNGDIPSGAVYNSDGTLKTENLTQEEQNQILYGNQFVWIPCTANTTSTTQLIYQKTDWGKQDTVWETATDEGEITYIEKYGGFYIGRFEAGTSNITFKDGETEYKVEDEKTSIGWEYEYFKSKYANGKITCKAGEIPYYNSDYITAKDMAKKMYNNDYVHSGLVTGTMWDVAVSYIKEKNGGTAFDVTSSPWGNYYNSTLTNCKGRYIDASANDGSRLAITTNSDGARHYGIMTCGSTEDVKKNNIYDMAGNLWEWTEEIARDLSNNYYSIRGR